MKKIILHAHQPKFILKTISSRRQCNKHVTLRILSRGKSERRVKFLATWSEALYTRTHFTFVTFYILHITTFPRRNGDRSSILFVRSTRMHKTCGDGVPKIKIKI